MVVDACGGWLAKSEVGPGGAILVRPDGHVAWRCERLGEASPAGGTYAEAAQEEAERLLGDAVARAMSKGVAP